MLALVDGDAFFASIEQAVKPHLKGKPVVTGKERNIVATASYEARAYGINLGVPLWDAKKMCPDLVILPTDYETVSLYSKRMHDIIRRFSPAVEEYGIDEAFADLKGLRSYHHASYEQIGDRLRNTVHSELGITVTVGIAKTKTLCKIAASLVKPNGLKLLKYLEDEKPYPVEDIWGVGPATAALLRKYSIHTAQQFASLSQERVEQLLNKPGVQTWQELNGIPSIEFEAQKLSYQSIGKTKTFTPPSRDKEYVFAQLLKNVENACMKARRYHQGAKKISIYLKKQDFRGMGIEAKLLRATAYPNDLTKIVRDLFEEVWIDTDYRATGVILSHLVPLNPIQPTLFDDPIQVANVQRLYGAVDMLREQYGKHSVHLAASLPAQRTQHISTRGDTPKRKETLLKGETKRLRLPLPMLQVTLR